MPLVYVVVPALNEEETIGAVVSAVPRDPETRVIVVDNGSGDRTGERATEAGATVVREPRRGYGAACLAGLAVARAAGADLIVLMDGDGSDAPEQMPLLLGPLRRGEADLVLGVRDPSRTDPGAVTLQQRFGNGLAVALMRLRFGARYSDLPPFKAMTAEALERLRPTDRGMGFTIELLLNAHLAGLRVLEVPVPCRRRAGGRSKVSGTVRGATRAGIAIFRAIFAKPRTRRGVYPETR